MKKIIIYSFMFFASANLMAKDICPRTLMTSCKDSCKGEYGYQCPFGYNCNSAEHKCERNAPKHTGGSERVNKNSDLSEHKNN